MVAEKWVGVGAAFAERKDTRYFVGKLGIVMIYALFERLSWSFQKNLQLASDNFLSITFDVLHKHNCNQKLFSCKKTMFLSQKLQIFALWKCPGILMCSQSNPCYPAPLTLKFNWFWVFELSLCYTVLFIIVHYCTYLQYHITWHIVVPAGGEPHHRIRLPPTPTNTTNIAAPNKHYNKHY